MGQALQLLGALMALAGFVGAQFKLIRQQSYVYLLLNFVGSAILAVLAFEQQQWGFLLLEGVVGARLALGSGCAPRWSPRARPLGRIADPAGQRAS